MAEIARHVLSNAPPRFALVGLSMGGYIAFEILRQAPRRVDRLALLDTSARSDTPEQSEYRQTLVSLVGSHPMEDIADRLFPKLVHPSRYGDEALHLLVRMMANETGTQVFIRHQYAIMGRPDSRQGLGAIDCPTLVVVGDSDALTPPELSEEIAGNIPGANLFVVPGCGHLSTLEQPHLITPALIDWLEAG